MSEKECLHGSTSEHCAYCMSDAEQKHQATFAALVEVARAAERQLKNSPKSVSILLRMKLKNLRALNPKLLEK